jgi:hypothetical protein
MKQNEGTKKLIGRDGGWHRRGESGRTVDGAGLGEEKGCHRLGERGRLGGAGVREGGRRRLGKRGGTAAVRERGTTTSAWERRADRRQSRQE